MDKYIDRIAETDDIEELNDWLDKGHIFINSYVKRKWVNDTCYETLVYSVGRRDKDRFSAEEIMDNL